jgi:hypothetical protein
MVERFGKPTRFHMSRGVEQGMAQWKTNPETLTILVWPEHVALELKVNNIDVEARKEALRKLEAQRDAKDL